MAALTKDRNTPEATGDMREGDAAAAVLIYAGAIVMRDAAGNLTKGQTATGLVGVGRAHGRFDNSTGAAGDVTVIFKPGVFRFENSSGGDEITAAAIGDLCYVVDDQTVALTNGGNTRSPAGIVHFVDPQGVFVRFDEALTNAS